MAKQSYRLMRLPNGKHDLVPLTEVNAWQEKHYPERLKGKSTLMPKKVERGSWVVYLDEAGKVQFVPRHLHTPTARAGNGVQIIKDIEPFQNIAVDNGYIGGRRQRRDMIRAHNLIEVGTEAPVNRFKGAPEATQREMVNSIKQAYRDHGVDVL